MNKQVFICQTLILVLLCGIVIFITDYNLVSKEVSGTINKQTPFNESTSNHAIEATTQSDTFTLNLSFIGDCLCATNENTFYENCFNDVAKKKKPSYFLKKVKHIFINDDFTIANCENVFSDSKKLTVSDKGQYSNPGIEAYWFKSSSKNANILSEGGIDCVSISNNHINDYGTDGYKDTKDALDSANLQWGEEGKIVYYKKNNFRISVICVSMYSSYAVDNIKKYIKTASKKSDYQIIYFHGGEEAVHEPEAWKIKACHDLIDAGADLVLGNHPHVLQPLDTYKGKTIIYSLGNFIFGGNRHPENRTIIYQHLLTITKGILVSENGNIIPCYVFTGETNNWQPDIITNRKQKKKVLDFMNKNSELPY